MPELRLRGLVWRDRMSRPSTSKFIASFMERHPFVEPSGIWPDAEQAGDGIGSRVPKCHFQPFEVIGVLSPILGSPCTFRPPPRDGDRASPSRSLSMLLIGDQIGREEMHAVPVIWRRPSSTVPAPATSVRSGGSRGPVIDMICSPCGRKHTRPRTALRRSNVPS